MKRILFLCVALSASVLRAEDSTTPNRPPVAAPAQTEMQKWIATTDAQWQAAFNHEVVDVHTAELKKLATQYASLLEAAINKATSAGDLDGAVALRNERQMFAETNVFPEQDLGPDAASVIQIRVAIRAQLAKVEKDNVIRTTTLHTKYDQFLERAQTQLTQRKRIDDALLVRNKRDEVAAAWLAGLPAPEPATAATAPTGGRTKPTPKPAIGLAGAPSARRISFRATVDAGDNVVVQNGKLHIEHIDWDKPKDISVNGIKWEPNWQDKTTDDFVKFDPPLAPFDGAHVSVHFTQRRKKNGAVKVLDRPTKANGQKLVVHLQDEGNGSSDFDVNITW